MSSIEHKKAQPTPVAAIVAALGIPHAEAEAIHAQMVGDLDGDVIHLDEGKAAPEPDDGDQP